MGLQFYWLVLGVLSVWRVTHLLNAEDGPWNLVVSLRQRAGTSFWAGLLDCFYCLSLWIAAPAAYFIGSRWSERFFLWLALSASIATGSYQVHLLVRFSPLVVLLSLWLPALLADAPFRVSRGWFVVVTACAAVTATFCYFPSFYA